eukprot:scaffold1862_cov268-Chaetoceros_neogracile.AAC.13
MPPKSKRVKRSSSAASTTSSTPTAEPAVPSSSPAAAASSSAITSDANATVNATASGTVGTRRIVQLADDADEVLAKCRELREELKQKAEQNKESAETTIQDNDANANRQDANPIANAKPDSSVSSASSGIASLRGKSIIEVSEMSTTEVVEAIESVAIQITNQVLRKKGFTLEIPSRASSNQIYVPELDRIVLGEKRGTRSFLNAKEARKSAITARVMQLLHTVLLKKIHITKRDLFYTDVKLFVDQSDSDGCLDDIATMIGCTRSNLHVVASDKGLVVGRISFVEDGDFIDCTKMGVGGKAIPPYIDKITDIRSDAEFVLLVEKEAAYMRMAEDRFYHKYPCIVITAKGQPDVATRMFLSRLTKELGIPVLGLVDSDPYGLKILSVYMSGSKNMSYDSASLTTPDIKWLGLRPSDLDKFDLPEQCRLDMTENDIKTGKELLKEDFIKKNKEWMKELEIMRQWGSMQEIHMAVYSLIADL